MKLTIELVPRSAWYSNVRSNVTQEQWDFIRRVVYRRAKYLCEICGVGNAKIHAHEIFSYDDKLHLQKLEKIMALCPKCYMVKHIGLATVKGNGDIALRHLMRVNEITKKEANEYINYQFKVWEHRSKFQWTLNIEYLNQFIFTIGRKTTIQSLKKMVK